jgi:hypothetical protein
MSDNDNELDNYYIIKFENFVALLRQTESIYNILVDLIQDYIQECDPYEWDKTPIPDLCAYLGVASELKLYLDDIINNPTEKEIELTIKYNLKDVLITLDDLAAMNVMLEAMQEYEVRVYQEHKITTVLQ